MKQLTIKLNRFSGLNGGEYNRRVCLRFHVRAKVVKFVHQ
jgi:hypothetical protein